MHRIVTALAVMIGIFSLSGCVTTPAVISDLEDDKVIVQAGLGTPDSEVMKMAEDGCALHGRTPATISTKCLDEYCIKKDVLFACVKP